MTLSAQANAYFKRLRSLPGRHWVTVQLFGGIGLVAVGVWIGSQWFRNDAGFTTNLYTELLSIGVTVLVLNWFAERRATRQRQQELFMQLGSQSNDFALEAKRQLEQLGWLEEALARKEFPRVGWQGMVLYKANLTRCHLWQANLANASLLDANLTQAKLPEANLTACSLQHANLTSAVLHRATLLRVELGFADLTNAVLMNADLSYASLRCANLTNAVLLDADLTAADLWDANLTNARFNLRTTLPDGAQWTPDTDLARFTDPEHAGFWRSDDPASPAYREA